MIDPQSLIDKIKGADHSKYEPVLLNEMASWIEQLQNIQARQALFDNFIITEMLEELRGKIVAMNTALLEERSMPELKRENLLDRKELYQEFIDRFNPTARLEEFSRIIEDNL